MRIVLCLLLFFSVNSHAQSLYRLIEKSPTHVAVRRTITVRPNHVQLARRIAQRQGQLEQVRLGVERAVITATMHQSLQRPTALVGTNNFLIKVAKEFRKTPSWKKISHRAGFNGSHHIVNKYVIKQIARGRSEIAANAPAVFHPLHGNPEFIHIFHDQTRQLELYETGGIQAIVLDFFTRINEVNRELQLPEYTEAQIVQTSLEAELWARHWDLRWE